MQHVSIFLVPNKSGNTYPFLFGVLTMSSEAVLGNVACIGVGSGDTSDVLFLFGVPSLFRPRSNRLLAWVLESVDGSMIL
jgi:hypothetical protein